jgi:addiction module HigA family antidote
MKTIDVLALESAPTHPGEMLQEEFLVPLGVSQSDFARRLGVSFPRLNDLIHGRRGVSTDTALRLARVLGTSPELWLNLQVVWDLWHAAQGAEGKAIAKLEPLRAAS